MFKNNGTDNWDELIRISATDAASEDRFGYSVDSDEKNIVIGARGKDDFTGTAYIFTEENTWTGTNNSDWNDPANWTDGAIPYERR